MCIQRTLIGLASNSSSAEDASALFLKKIRDSCLTSTTCGDPEQVLCHPRWPGVGLQYRTAPSANPPSGAKAGRMTVERCANASTGGLMGPRACPAACQAGLSVTAWRGRPCNFLYVGSVCLNVTAGPQVARSIGPVFFQSRADVHGG